MISVGNKNRHALQNGGRYNPSGAYIRVNINTCTHRGSDCIIVNLANVMHAQE
jgi:hypothetical protein